MQSIFQGDFFEVLGHSIRKNGVERIMVVAGKSSFEKCGAEDIIEDLEGIEYVVYNHFSENPKFEDMLGGIKLLNEFKPDVVLAVGGGSAMDIAKLIVAFADKDSADLDAYMTGTKTLEALACPLWVAPTTAGSGSESTHFSVVYYKGKKHSVCMPVILPSIVFLDSILTYTVPRDVAVSGGLNVMCQAMESYWSNASTDESRVYAKEAMQLCLTSIIPALEGEIKEQRDLQYAGYLSGKASNLTKENSGYNFAHYLTQNHNVMHGHGVAVMLQYVFDYAIKEADESILRKCQSVAEVLDIELEEIPQFLEEMMEEFKIGNTVRELGVTTSDELKALCESVSTDDVKTNPVELDLKNSKQ